MNHSKTSVEDEQIYEPQIGDSVVVNEPRKNDAWTHSFIGVITDIIENDEDKTYIIEDQDSDMWRIEREMFEVAEDLA